MAVDGRDTRFQALPEGPMSGGARTPLVICLGSSCFARGNGANLPLVQDHLARKGLLDRVDLRGSRCEGHCMTGPNLRVGEALVGEVQADTLEATLDRLLPAPSE